MQPINGLDPQDGGSWLLAIASSVVVGPAFGMLLGKTSGRWWAGPSEIAPGDDLAGAHLGGFGDCLGRN